MASMEADEDDEAEIQRQVMEAVGANKQSQLEGGRCWIVSRSSGCGLTGRVGWKRGAAASVMVLLAAMRVTLSVNHKGQLEKLLLLKRGSSHAEGFVFCLFIYIL